MLFDRLAGFAGALLNAAHQFVLLAFKELQIVIREAGVLIFQRLIPKFLQQKKAGCV